MQDLVMVDGVFQGLTIIFAAQISVNYKKLSILKLSKLF